MNTGWITDRLPTEEDGVDGHVLATSHDGQLDIFLWNEVEDGEAWQRLPAPYVKPKRWTVKFSVYDNTWIMRDNVEGWVRLLYIDRCHGDAAQRIADIYNEVKP